MARTGPSAAIAAFSSAVVPYDESKRFQRVGMYPSPSAASLGGGNQTASNCALRMAAALAARIAYQEVGLDLKLRVMKALQKDVGGTSVVPLLDGRRNGRGRACREADAAGWRPSRAAAAA